MPTLFDVVLPDCVSAETAPRSLNMPLILALLACAPHVPTPRDPALDPRFPDVVPAPHGLDPELVLMWRNGARAVDGGLPAVGKEVAVHGFAENSGVTAVVYRGNILLRCLDRDRWEPDLLEEFVVARGVLARRDTPPIKEFERGEEISFLTLFLRERPGAGLFEMATCDVTRGATDADVHPPSLAALSSWKGLTFPGGVATLGADVVIEGTPRWLYDGPNIEWIKVPCVERRLEGQRVRVRGKLEYRPVPWLRNVSFDDVGTPAWGPGGSFFLRTCEVEPLP